MNNRKNHRLRETGLRLLLILLMINLLSGCAGKKIEKKDPFFDKWRVKAERSKGYSPSARKRTIDLPKKISGAVPEKTKEAEPEKPLPTQKITLEMHSVEVAVLLRALAKAANQNIMISESVAGRIDINVKDVPWNQVFRGILRTKGLSYSWEEDIIRIITLQDKNKSLNQLEAEQKIKAKKRALQLEEPLLTKVIRVDYADAKKLQGNLEKFLTVKETGKPYGSVMVDEHTNSLIIQGNRGDIERMIPLILELDRPTPQILIEAHIVETTRETARELGVQWGGLSKSGSFFITPGANSEGVFGQRLSEGSIDPTSGIAANFPAEFSKVQGASGLYLGFAFEELGKQLLALQLSALQEEGKLNILSSPSITTLDNQAAVIESGREIPFQTVEGTGDNRTVQIEFKKAVLSLEVTPHVIDGETIKMKIVTRNDEADFTNAIDGNPPIITKNAETEVIIFDGQTTVIGGLNKETGTKSESGVPGLKDIPFLGYLFKDEGKSNRMEEVLIFITPHILKEQMEGESPEEPKRSH